MISLSILDAEARAAAAARGCIWIGHLERGASKILDIIHLATVNEIKADGVNDKGNPVGDRNGVTFLKVSHTELIDAGYCGSDDRGEVVAGAARLKQSSGAQNVVVSRAADPTVAIIGERLLEVAGPRFEPLDPHGGGDSMTAALAVGCARGMDAEAALRLAAAAGTLNVTRHGLGSGRRLSIEAIAERVELRPLSP